MGSTGSREERERSEREENPCQPRLGERARHLEDFGRNVIQVSIILMSMSPASHPLETFILTRIAPLVGGSDADVQAILVCAIPLRLYELLPGKEGPQQASACTVRCCRDFSSLSHTK